MRCGWSNIRVTPCNVFLTKAVRSASEQKEFEWVAQKIGTLSFFIETLQHQSDTQNNHFTFDEEAGVFCVNPLDCRALTVAPQPDPAVQVIDAGADSLPELATLDDELALSLTTQPHDAGLQEQIKESLVKMRIDAILSDNPEASVEIASSHCICRAALDFFIRNGRGADECQENLAAAAR